MFTTTKRTAFALAVVFIGWIAIMATVMRLSDVAPAAVVFFPSPELLADLPDDTSILGLERFRLTVVNATGGARALYDAGAWLVLPAGLTGCLPLTKAQKAQLLARQSG